MHRISRILPVLFMIFCCNVLGVEINWSGFMTVAGGKVLTKDGEYRVGSINESSYTDSFSFDAESKVGLQAQAMINDRTRVTALIIARSGNEGYETELDWGYASFDLANNTTLHAGRLRTPLYFYSESKDIGYSYYWIRPPPEFYWISIETLEGISVYHRNYINDIGIVLQGWYGSSSEEFESAINVTLNNNTGIKFEAEYQWLKFCIGVAQATAVVDAGPFTSTTDVQYSFTGVLLDYEKWFWHSEYSYTYRDRQALNDDDDLRAWYTSIGYSFQELTPHLTFAHQDDNTIIDSQTEIDTWTLGLAWYFQTNTVTKFEYSLSEKDYALGEDDDIDLVSVAIDLIF